jgi:acyl-[acyl-carrier-protein]-phospholipid O-acyltransferase/long-chain-fatty-acid--[acyl-carrier-protein] ligase
LVGKDKAIIEIVTLSYEVNVDAAVLIKEVDVDLAQLRDKLRDAGVPNLWIPKRVQRVDAIPVLASGKLDLTKCKDLAERSA